MSASPCSTKCSAVVTVSSARTIPSCTVSPLLSLHFWIRDTTCTAQSHSSRYAKSWTSSCWQALLVILLRCHIGKATCIGHQAVACH